MRTPSTDGRAKGAKLQRAGGSDGLLQALICGAQFIAEALQGCLDALAALVKTSFRDEAVPLGFDFFPLLLRSEEHTSELQSLMRISYAVFCLKKKIIINYIRQQLPYSLLTRATLSSPVILTRCHPQVT